MFEPFKFYKHELMRDVAIEVIRTKGGKTAVNWWNLNKVGKPFPLNVIEEIEIKEPSKWVQIEDLWEAADEA